MDEVPCAGTLKIRIPHGRLEERERHFLNLIGYYIIKVLSYLYSIYMKSYY